MKKFLIGLGALVAVVVAAALVAPGFIDWNQYRALIANEASAALGRTVEIRGKVGLSLLPAPLLYVNDAHLANIEGATDADMASLASLEVRVALAPLLAGSVRIESVKLVRPVFNLEILEDGRSNMTFERDIGSGRGGDPQPRIPLTTGARIETFEGGGFDISVDDFVVEKGTIVFRNSASGYVERVDELNGRFSFASLRGPMSAVASAVVRGVPLTVEVSAAPIIQGRTMPLNLDISVAPGGIKAQFSGSLNGLDEMPRLKGKLSLDGDNLAEFVAGLGAASLPDVLRRPFGSVGTLSIGSDGGEVGDLTVRLDGAQAQGRLAVTLGDAPAADATLAVSHLDLDSLLRPPATAPAAKGPVAARAKATSLEIPAKSRVQDTSPGRRGAASGLLETLPAELTANFNLAIEVLTWRDEIVRQAKMNLSLANREITVNQLSGLLPGNTDVAFFGFVTDKDGALQFDGTVDAVSNDLRAIVDWTGISTAGVASERLRALGLNAKISARADVVGISELRARLDGTRIDGAATVSFGERLSVGANVALDRLNLDAYLPVGAVEAATSETAAGSSNTATASPSSPGNPLSALAPLAGFDANLRARIGALTLKGLPFDDVRIEAALADGVLDVKSASVADVAGVSASLSGALTALKASDGATADPRFRDMVLQAKGKSLVPLFRLADIHAPVPAEALGATALTSRLSGTLRALDFGLELHTMGGRASLSGNLQSGALLPRLDGRFAVAHPDLVRLVRAFGVDYRPRGASGGIEIAGKIEGSPIELALSDVKGLVGGVRVQGGAGINLLGRRPRVAVQLATGDLDLDSFLPAKRTAVLDERARVQPASFQIPPASVVPRGVVLAAAPWSSERIDVSVLAVVDGTFAIASDSLKYGGLALANADVDAELKQGALALRRLTGKAFGGDLTLDGALVPEGQGARLQTRYALGGLDIGAAERAFGGKGAARGSLTSEGRLSGTGRSVAEIVASLAGEGALAVRGLEPGDGAGSALGAIGGIAQSLDRIASAAGGRQKSGVVDLSGPYRVANGVVTFDELAVTSAIGEGAVKGKIDLPKWQIAAAGEIRLAKSLLTELAVGDAAAAKPVPFEVTGALDAPRVKLDIAKLPGGGVRVPGLDRLREKKGVGEILERVLPPSAKRQPPKPDVAKPEPPRAAAPAPAPAPAPAAQPPPPQPESPPEQKKADRAQDILRDILKGIAR